MSADEPISNRKMSLRPLIGLMGNQPAAEIERYLIDEIKKHRRLRDEAVMLEARLVAAVDEDEVKQATRAFIPAMIAVHAQHTVVSTLLEILGYMPEMPGVRRH